MANKKISELPSATALSNGGVVELLQSGINAKFDIAGEFRKTRTVTTSDSVLQTDDNSLIIFNSGSPINFTLDQLVASTKVSFLNIGAGAVTFVAGSGVTITGSTTLAAAASTTYPTAFVFYHTATTPRTVVGSAGGGGGGDTWGSITGTLSSQTDLQSALDAKKKVIELACSDETTPLTTGTAKITFRMPYALTLSSVRASLSTAQTSGSIFTVDINEAGSTILSTKLTIDNTEKTSTTAATPPVISDASIADDAEITIDIDQIGDGTAKGLKIYMIGL